VSISFVFKLCSQQWVSRNGEVLGLPQNLVKAFFPTTSLDLMRELWMIAK